MANPTAARDEEIQLIGNCNYRAIDNNDGPTYPDIALPVPSPQNDSIYNTRTENTAHTSQHDSYTQHPDPSVGPYYTMTDSRPWGHPWRDGLWASFPHRGMWALFGCLACTTACIIILLECNGMPQEDWIISPTVYVSALTAVTNTLARFAFANGVKITWWRRALKGGSLADLHHRWSHADGFWSALLAGRHFNPIALSCIAVTIIVIDQPLIQRAVSVVSVQRISTVEISVAIAPEISWGYTGYQNGRGWMEGVMTQPMFSVLNDYNSKSLIKPPMSECRGNCTGFIEAGGLAAQCNSTTAPAVYLYNKPENILKYESPFSISFKLDDPYTFERPPPIVADIVYSDKSNETTCEATRTHRTCHIYSATIRYPVTISQSAINLGDISENSSVVSLQPMNTEESGHVDYGGTDHLFTLGGLYLAADMIFSSNATYRWSGAIGNQINLQDSMSSQFLNRTSPRQDPTSGMDTIQNLTWPSACSANWTDPTSFIISSLNTMAFMLSISAAKFEYRNTSAPPPRRTWPMQETRLVNVYKIEYSYLFTSIAITLSLVVLIMPTFVGWWELGRSVTLNPIETAKAFEAPLLSGPGSNAPLKDLIRDAGRRRIKYGDVSVIEEKTNGLKVVRRQLVFREADEVTTPKNGFVYE